MSNPLKTKITELLGKDPYKNIYTDADTAINTLKNEEALLTSKAIPLWKEVFEQFTIDELVQHSSATRDRINLLINIHNELKGKSEATIAGMDYNTLSQFSADDEVPETLRKIRENIHLHERFMAFRGNSNNEYLKGRGDELKKIEQKLAIRYSQLLRELKSEGFSYSQAKQKADAIIKAEYDVLEFKLKRKYPTSFEGNEIYSVFKEYKV